MFRRAVVENDQAAWAAVFAQYRCVVHAWLRRHPAASLASELDGYLVNRAFERFWLFVRPERFDTFAGVPALLRYLKLCAHSALMDELREQEKSGRHTEIAGEHPHPQGLERDVIGRIAARELWGAITTETRDEDELIVATLSFLHGLKPQEIRERYPDRYADVAEVYRVKSNLLNRLRRNETIRRTAEPPSGPPRLAP